MAVKLYLRDLTAADPPTTGEKSSVNPSTTLGANNATGTQETRALRLTPGSAETSIAHNSDASTAARDNYLARFTSEPLSAVTFGSGTWTVAIALSQTNAQANSTLALSLYVWRPGTSSVVGYIYDSSASLGSEWSNGEDGQVATFSGANVTPAQGDVLVLEVWRVTAGQGMSTAYAQTVYFEGATDVVETTTSDAASYVETPADFPLLQTLALSTVSSTQQLFAPTVALGAQQLTLPTIASTAALLTPTLSAQIALPVLASSTTLSAPTVAPGAVSLSLPTIATTLALTTPTVTVGAVSLTLPTRASAATLGPPTVSEAQAIAFLVSPLLV